MRNIHTRTIGYEDEHTLVNLDEMFDDIDHLALTYQFWNGVSPAFMEVDTLNNVHIGYEFMIGEHIWRVTDISAMAELVFINRVNG